MYRVIQRLGSGGNAVTYLVVATTGTVKVGVPFVLKVFRVCRSRNAGCFSSGSEVSENVQSIRQHHAGV